MTHAKLNRTVFMVSLIAALAGLLFGFDTGIISGALLFIEKQFVLSTGAKELIVSSVLIGAMLGSLSSGSLTDRFGRRKVMLIIATIFIIGTLTASFAPSVNIILVGRILIGFAIGIGSYTAPLYIAEAAPFEYRGGLVSLNQLAITIGIMCSYFINYAFVSFEGSWRWMFLIGVVPAVLLGFGMLFLPESPRWLVKQGFKEKAEKTLRKLRGSEDVSQEIKEIEHSIKLREPGFMEVFSPWIRKVLFLGIFLGFIQQVTGINTLIYYAPTIFQMAGFHDASSSILATAGLGIVNVLATVFAIFYLDKWGRRALLFVGLVGMGISLSCLSFAFHMGPANSDVLRWMSVISAFVFIISFAISLGPLLWLMVAEIFPLEIRGAVMSLTVFISWFWNFAVSFTFLTLVNFLGPSKTFLVYAIMCGIGLVIGYFFVPETKGVSLERIEENIRAGLPIREIGAPSK